MRGVHLPHQVRAQRRVVITHTGAGLELHLAKPTQPPHVRTSWRKTKIEVKRDLLITPREMML